VALQKGSSDFDETYHWHTGRPLEEAYWQEASKDQASIHVRIVSILALNLGAYGFSFRSDGRMFTAVNTGDVWRALSHPSLEDELKTPYRISEGVQALRICSGRADYRLSDRFQI
jgi:hypothetical protein